MPKLSRGAGPRQRQHYQPQLPLFGVCVERQHDDACEMRAPHKKMSTVASTRVASQLTATARQKTLSAGRAASSAAPNREASTG